MHTFITEVRETLAPGRTDHFGPLPPLLVAMTVVTGLVDSFSYLLLGPRLRRQHHRATSSSSWPSPRSRAVPAASPWRIDRGAGRFRVGSVLGGRIVQRFGHHRGHHVAVATGTQALLVAVALVLALVGTQPFGSGFRYALIVYLALSMGLQNSSVRRLAVPDLTTTVLTLTVTGIGADTALGGGTAQLGERLISIAAMFLGALAGAAFILHVHFAVPLILALAIVFVVALIGHVAGRSNPEWTRVEE